MAPVMVHGLVQQRFDARLHVAPRARIQRLLLAPDDVLRVRIAVQVLLELLPGERVHLLDARYGCVVDSMRGAVFLEGGVDLA